MQYTCSTRAAQEEGNNILCFGLPVEEAHRVRHGRESGIPAEYVQNAHAVRCRKCPLVLVVFFGKGTGYEMVVSLVDLVHDGMGRRQAGARKVEVGHVRSDAAAGLFAGGNGVLLREQEACSDLLRQLGHGLVEEIAQGSLPAGGRKRR